MVSIFEPSNSSLHTKLQPAPTLDAALVEAALLETAALDTELLTTELATLVVLELDAGALVAAADDEGVEEAVGVDEEPPPPQPISPNAKAFIRIIFFIA